MPHHSQGVRRYSTFKEGIVPARANLDREIEATQGLLAIATTRQQLHSDNGGGDDASNNAPALKPTSPPAQAEDVADWFAFAFDVNGVLVRGGQAIPEAVEVTKVLNGKNAYGITIPHIFLTDSVCSKAEAERCWRELPEQLRAAIEPAQLVEGAGAKPYTLERGPDAPPRTIYFVTGGGGGGLDRNRIGSGSRKDGYSILVATGGGSSAEKDEEASPASRAPRATVPTALDAVHHGIEREMRRRRRRDPDLGSGGPRQLRRGASRVSISPAADAVLAATI